MLHLDRAIVLLQATQTPPRRRSKVERLRYLGKQSSAKREGTWADVDP